MRRLTPARGSVSRTAKPVLNETSRGVETMSNAESWGRPRAGRPPRVRDQAREVLAVVAFSALMASALALGLLLLTTVGRQG